MGLLSKIFPRTLARFHSSVNDDIRVVKEGKNISLRVNEVEQSGEYVDALFSLALKKLPLKPSLGVKNILVFGIGGGVVLKQLKTLYPAAYITGVDIDKKIIDIAKTYFDLDLIQNSVFVVSDAREYVKGSIRKKKFFDMVIVDIYIGNDVPDFVTQKKFLKNVKKILQPGGLLIVNYFSYFSQREKSKILFDTLSKAFTSVRVENVFRNKFFYCADR